MRSLVLPALLALIASPLSAAPARVISGEHGDFTRLVVDAGAPGDWALGRSEGGYELRIPGLADGFDTEGVFGRLSTERLVELVPGPGPGSLQVVLGCDCHIAPFQVEPGVVALDIRDGPAPMDSLYEGALDLSADEAPPPPAALTPPRPESPLSSAWIARTLGQATGLSPAEPAPGRPADSGVDPLRDSLMREISRGAARGVVGMELPKTKDGVPEPGAQPAQARLGFGALPQISVSSPSGAPDDLAAEGAVCPGNDRLDMTSWGDDRPVWQQIPEARSRLTGEFDKPDPEATARAIRFHLYIGFGQEALSLMQAFGTGAADLPLWSSMAHLIDDIPDPAPAFAGFGACDSAASLWAFMAGAGDAGALVNFPAVQRAFSTLPADLRQTIGPRLIERLVAAGAEGTVEAVANAIRRPGGDGNREIALMNAELAGNQGNFEKADALLRPLLEDPGPGTPEAMVALIEGHAQRALPLPAVTLEEIDAYAAERLGGPDGPEFQRALILALALSGNPGRAFDEARGREDVQADLWRLLSGLGTDNDILELATIPPGAMAPAAGAGVALVLAERFLGLSLPDQAQRWLAGAERLDLLLAARVAVARRDGLSAMAYLEGLAGDEAEELRLAALVLTGKAPAIALALKEHGRSAEADAVLARSGDWAALSQDAQPHWQLAANAALLPADSRPLAGPLAEGAVLVDRAVQTREAVRALLAAVPPAEIPAP